MIRTLFWLAVTVAPAAAQGWQLPGWLWPAIRRDCKSLHLSGLKTEIKIQKIETCVADIVQDRPVHPTGGSVVPSSGIGLGAGLVQDLSWGSWQNLLSGKAFYTTKGFWDADAKLDLMPRLWSATCFSPLCTAGRPRIELRWSRRELRRLDYFGIGPLTPRTPYDFEERDTSIAADGFIPILKWVRIGGTLEYLRPRIGFSADPSTVTGHFSERTAPGLFTQPAFLHYTAYLKAHSNEEPPYLLDYAFAYSLYQDRGTGIYSFARYETGATLAKPLTLTRQVHPTSRRGSIRRFFCTPFDNTEECDFGVLTLSGRADVSQFAAGHQVPFYLQPTLGGTDIDGMDALRGFNNYRFRGPDRLLLQAEYSHDVWGPIGLFGFYDVGHVALDPADLLGGHFRHDIGFGLELSVMKRSVFRLYIGFGGGEGLRPHYNFGQFR